jgi:hypothetical protein
MKSPNSVSPSPSPTFVCKGDGLLGHAQHGAHAIDRQVHLFRDFLRRRVAPEFLQQLLVHTHQLVDRLDHVHRDADRAGLISNRARDRLADPPRRVGGEFVAAAVLEFLHRAHEAHVALLDQVEEGQPAIGVFFWRWK